MEPTRRRLLQTGGALAALSAPGVAWGHRPLGALESPFLGSSPRRTLESALEALLPTHAPVPALVEGIDAFLAAGDPLQGGDLRLALVVLEHGGLTGFSRLDLKDRVARLKAWESSGSNTKRQIFQALRRTAMFSYYSTPASWEALGYEGTWVE